MRTAAADALVTTTPEEDTVAFDGSLLLQWTESAVYSAPVDVIIVTRICRDVHIWKLRTFGSTRELESTSGSVELPHPVTARTNDAMSDTHLRVATASVGRSFLCVTATS